MSDRPSAQDQPRVHVLVLVTTLALAACTAAPTAVRVPSTLTPRPVTRMIAPGMPGLDLIPERPLYAINVAVEYNPDPPRVLKVLNVQERVEFKNPAAKALAAIKFNVPPARHPGAITIRDARIFGQPAALKFEQAGTVLTVQLPAPLPVGAAIALSLDYTLRLPDAEVFSGVIGGDDSSVGEDGMIAGHWYVMLAPYRADEWETPGYYPVGDSYTAELADYEVTVLAPAGVIVAGAGDETHDEAHSPRQWRYELRNARVFAFAASDQFVVERSVADGVTISHYGLPRHSGFGEDVLITAERALRLYSGLYGLYPYRTLRIVETDRAQGQEYSALVGLGSLLYEGYPGSGARHDLIASTAHEVSHQWWFQEVGNDQIHTPWLDEAFARMAEVKFYEAFYPADVEWWMDTYLRSRKPSGPMDGSLATFPDAPSYLNAVYRRGAMFLLAVRAAMGGPDFDAAMRDYYASQLHRITTPDAFFDALSRHTTADLGPVVREYFAAPPKLPCRISANAAGCRK